jgi:hypothetical protein
VDLEADDGLVLADLIRRSNHLRTGGHASL